MSSNNSNIKLLCEEFYSSNYNEENTIKILNKILSILKVSEKYQKDIFIFLTDKGLNKLLQSLKDNNIDVRKLSMKIIIEILYNNEVLQNIFCEKFNFNPIGNTICLNWLPKNIKDNIRINEKFINELKNSFIQTRSLKYWMWPENLKYTDDLVPDPMKYLIGFNYANKSVFFNFYYIRVTLLRIEMKKGWTPEFLLLS
jgi:hypothetical protein